MNYRTSPADQKRHQRHMSSRLVEPHGDGDDDEPLQNLSPPKRFYLEDREHRGTERQEDQQHVEFEFHSHEESSIVCCGPLNNLALLLKATNRLADAEPLYRRAVLILAAFTRHTGHAHPHLEAALENYGSLLGAMGRTDDEKSRPHSSH